MIVTTGDGRDLEVVVDGPDTGEVLLFHAGTPMGPVTSASFAAAAAARGLRWVTYGRPGYGRSTRHPGRTVADCAADTAAVLDALGADRFVTVGVSGGGPHALACGALLPDRCGAAAVVAGVAPYDADGLDFLAGMGPENVEEFGLGAEGEQALAPFVEAQGAALAEVTAAEVAEAMGGLVPPVDRAALTGELADWIARAFRKSQETGAAGWLDDTLAFTRPWGFAIEDVAVPVSLWQGTEDLMVPFAHGRWLADRLPDVRAHLLDGEGHLSVLVGRMDALVGEVAELAGL